MSLNNGRKRTSDVNTRWLTELDHQTFWGDGRLDDRNSYVFMGRKTFPEKKSYSNFVLACADLLSIHNVSTKTLFNTNNNKRRGNIDKVYALLQVVGMEEENDDDGGMILKYWKSRCKGIDSNRRDETNHIR